MEDVRCPSGKSQIFYANEQSEWINFSRIPSICDLVQCAGETEDVQLSKGFCSGRLRRHVQHIQSHG